MIAAVTLTPAELSHGYHSSDEAVPHGGAQLRYRRYREVVV